VAIAIEFAVRKTEGVAREQMPRSRVKHAHVVARVPGGVKKNELTAIQLERRLVGVSTMRARGTGMISP
jgi:hypothetical protein